MNDLCVGRVALQTLHDAGFPQSWKRMEKIKSLKMGKQNKVMKIENILKKSWNFCTAYHESLTRSSDNSISIRHAVIWLIEAFSLCSRF